VSIVGGGGKSSLMFALAEGLPGRVILTTTTRIFAAQMKQSDCVCSLTDPGWEAELDGFGRSGLLVGGVEGERAVGVPRELPARLLARPGVDWVVVEADGSRMLPVKAPADHEPVVPVETDLLVVVVGIDALSAPICEVAHRPERVCAITGLGPDETLGPETLATLLTSPDGGLKDAPPAARAVVLINKVEAPTQHEAARQVAEGILNNPRVERVVVGALRGPESAGFRVVTR
jgi:molybdenum cofactor cytidylyltransferase